MREAPGVGAPTLGHLCSDKLGHDGCKSRPQDRIEREHTMHGVQALTRHVRRSRLVAAGGTATMLAVYHFAIATSGTAAWRAAQQKP
jgi:hypothetical protein